ncbi:S-adenosyl-L-methionine-dependent methyltransferase [Amylocystis lapponica]|nr:S-adenosyl-L-methionine-dependent methyltransferase [Amylocystis lapponica]
MPQSAYWVAVYTARAGDPVWGPVATHAVVILPVLFLGVALVKALQDPAAAGQQLITLPVCQTSITALQELWSAFRPISQTPPSQIILLLGALTLAIWTVAPFLPSIFPTAAPATAALAPAEPVKEHPASPSKSKTLRKKGAAQKPAVQPTPTPAPQSASADKPKPGLLRLGMLPLVPALLTTVLQPPTLRAPLERPYVHPTYPLRILSSVHSGRDCGPGDPLNLRYLRAGHSLIGGVWVGDLAEYVEAPVRDAAGEPLGDSIYSAFVLQEAARLVVRDAPQEHERALIMCRPGAGVCAASFMRHGFDTTLVELDPVVYDAARRYFGLPEPAPDRLVLRDPRSWVRERRDALAQELFDVVVHDVFSGGGSPGHLFTQQFWEDVKGVMRADGVIAVNHFEKLGADSSRAILLTLESVFGLCRAFGDTSELSETHGPPADEPLNWVIFCSASAKLPTFRRPTDADFLGSPLRKIVLSTLPLREADLGPIRAVPEKNQSEYILRDEANGLKKWSALETLGHWKMMREVFPDVIWETY